jgi:HUS1 checkpoint protein
MKFKAVLRKPTVLRDVCGALSGTCKSCQMRVYKDRLLLVSSNDTNSSQVWTTLPAENMFEQLNVVSKYGEVVIMEINVESLYRALKSYSSSGMAGGEDVVLRLFKRDQRPLLMVCFQHSSSTGDDDAYVAHEMPVKLVRLNEAESIQEPECPPPDVYVMMPKPITSVVRICDRYRYLGQRITIAANNEGLITMALAGEAVRVETSWKDAVNVQAESTTECSQERDPAQMASVTVNAKDWWNALQINVICKSMIVALCDQVALVLYCHLTDDQEEVLTYYMSHMET